MSISICHFEFPTAQTVAIQNIFFKKILTKKDSCHLSFDSTWTNCLPDYKSLYPTHMASHFHFPIPYLYNGYQPINSFVNLGKNSTICYCFLG